MGFLFLANLSEFKIEGHENANDINEQGKEHTRKAYNPCKDDLFDRQLTIEEARPFLRF
jgi:hypothetical protein